MRVVKLDRVDARNQLDPRRDPYWQRISEGRYLGFRKMYDASPGNWLARFYLGAKRYKGHSLGDFVTVPEKQRFDAAKREAEEWFRHLDMGGSTVAVTVKKACESYVKHLKAEKGEAAGHDAEGRFKRLIDADAIAGIDLKKLVPRHVVEWKERLRAKGGSDASMNRNLTALRAALNLAHKRRDVASDHAWVGELRPKAGADGRRDLYLKRPARLKLVKASTPEARRFLQVLMLLPLRPGDVAKLKVSDFDAQHGTLAIPAGKTKKRIIPVGADAGAHFKACKKGKLPTAWLITRDDGSQWTRESWGDAVKTAAAVAKLPRDTVAYTLRHCCITDLVTDGLDLFTVAQLSGTSVAMIEKHYGHLQREHARSALDNISRGRK